MKKIKIFLFSSIFLIASLVAVGFYIFSPSISYAVTATGSFSNPSCIIADFESSCEPTFSYATSNATNPLVSTPGELELSTAESNDITDTHSLEMGSSREYFLYNNGITGVLMDRMTIYPTCASGNWSVNHCLPSESSFSNYGSLSASSCDVPELGISCLATISWGITSVNDIGENVRIYINGKNLLKTISTSSSVKSGSFTATVPYGTNTFYLEGASGVIKKATGQAVCYSGTVWDNTKCLNVNDWNDTVLDNFTVNRCSIPEGSETCDVRISWGINPFSGNDTAIVKASVNGSVSTAFEGNSGSNRVYTVGKNIVEFSLYYRDTLLVSVSGSPTYGDFNTNTNTRCVIEAMQSTCVPSLLWGVSNSVYLPYITSSINNVSTNITSGSSGLFNDSSRALGNNENRNYYIYHNGTQLDSVNIASVCATGTEWSGTMCSPAKITVTDCVIAQDGKTCSMDWSVTWNSNYHPEIYTMFNDFLFFGGFAVKTGTTTIFTESTRNTGTATYITTVPSRNGSYTLTSPAPRTYDVIWDSKVIASTVAASTCAAGNFWVASIWTEGGKCIPAYLNASSCKIGLGESTCVNAIDWQFPKFPAGEASVYVRSSIPGGLAGGVGDCHASTTTTEKCSSWTNLNYGSTNFTLYSYFQGTTAHPEFAKEVSIATSSPTATCGISNGIQLGWSGSKCVLPTGTITRKTCEIPINGDSCSANVTWQVTNPVPTANTEFNAYFVDHPSESPSNPQSTALSGTKSITATKRDGNTGVTNTNLWHNGVKLAESSVIGQCISGSVWNWEGGGQKCISKEIPLDGSLNSSNCIVPIGGRDCQFDLDWNAWSTVDSHIVESSINILYDGEAYGRQIPKDQLSEQYYEPALDANWISDHYFDQITISNTNDVYNSAKYTLPDMDIDFGGSGGNGIMHKTATFNLIGKYTSTSGNNYYPVISWATVTAVCRTGSRWVGNVCEAYEVPVVTMGVIKTAEQTVVSTWPNWIPKIDLISGIISQIWGNRTVPAFEPETPVTISWSVNVGAFDLESINCKLRKDDSSVVLQEWTKTFESTYNVSPSSTSKYSVTCTNGQ